MHFSFTELESYSNIMSTFRAQGVLNENKKHILTELRTILHISIDRHKSEARRVTNDEELSTIAEKYVFFTHKPIKRHDLYLLSQL